MATVTDPTALGAEVNEGLFRRALARLHRAGDPELAMLAPLPAVVADLQRDDLAAIEVVARACEAYADRPALGTRVFELQPLAGGTAVRYLPDFRAISYRTLWERVRALAAGMVREPRLALRPGDGVGILGFGSVDYVVADLACLYAGAVSAVLQAGLAAGDLQPLLAEAEVALLVVAREQLAEVRAILPACPSVRAVIVMDSRPEAAGAAPPPGAGAVEVSLTEVAAAGRAAGLMDPWLPARDQDPLATLMYTSGSSGSPKGALLTHRIWRRHWQIRALAGLAEFPHVGLSFYPLSHAMGRNAIQRTLVLGGVTHFAAASDLSTLFEDIRLVRPTVLNLVPRVSELIHQAWRKETGRRVRAGWVGEAQAGAQAMADLRGTFLGDRLVAMVIGAAPTAPEVVSFLRDGFEVPVYEIYGSTEAGVLTVDGRVARPTVEAFRLADVPELGYRRDDQPFPRGELRVKTAQCVPGYFRNPAASQALFDPDGYLRTGDIVEQRGPEHLRWVDRMNNVVKLAQGEYVTLGRLESVYSSGSPLLDQVYLAADSRRAFLLAVVVPDRAALDEVLRERDLDPTEAAIKQLLRAEFNRVAGVAGLRPFEVPRDALVETRRWTRENGFLTGVGKPARPQLKRAYGERLEALYDRLEAERGARGLALVEEAAGLPLDQKLARAVAAVLGLPEVDLGAGSFPELGGDSLHALALVETLAELGVQADASTLLDPGRSLREALARLHDPRDRAPALPRFRDVHGAGATTLRAADLRLEAFLSPADLEAAAAVAAQPLPASVQSVLLTGASGFLGQSLVLAWLRRLGPSGGRLTCLVRAGSDAEAEARLRRAFQVDPFLADAFEGLAKAGHLTAVAGDLAAPGLGLEPAGLARLEAETELIVHAGALVNHVYAYEQLFGPNVAGAAQVLRLALRTRRKAVDFISTVGVLAGARGEGPVLEADGVAALRDAWPAVGGYAHGYAASKWAGEVLFTQGARRFQVPVRIFRPSMILPHRTWRGLANGPDMLSRLLVGILVTGLAPGSFYRGGRAVPAAYDGLPVDFIAEVIVALGSAGRDGLATYHAGNPHRNLGVSLDTLVDWAEAAGHPLRRIDPYEAWLATFRDRLMALPAERRQRTCLPILHAYAEPLDPAPLRADLHDFLAAVAQAKPGGELAPPRLTAEYLAKYVGDLEALGLLG